MAISPWAQIRQGAQPDTPPPDIGPWAPVPDVPAPVEGMAKPARVVEDPIASNIEYHQAQAQKYRDALARPWGTPNNHPGKLGKVAHIFSEVGNIAGNIVAPNVMANIPGTQLYNESKQAGNTAALDKELGEKSTQEQQGAQTAYQQSEADTNQAKLPYVGPEAEAKTELDKAQAEMMKNSMNGMNDPALHQAFTTLADPAATTAERRMAMALISQSPIGMNPKMRGVMTGAGQIYRQGETGSRVGGHNLIPDASSPTGYSQQMYDHLGNPMGTMPVQPTATNPLLIGPQAGDLIEQKGRLAGTTASAVASQGLIPIIDPTTNRVIGYAPKGTVASASGAGKTGVHQAMQGGLTPAPTGTVIGQGQMANSLTEMIQKNIYPAIDTAAAAGDTGIFSGRVEDFLATEVGNPDSPAARLKGTLDAVPMMLGRMYGYRSAEFAEHMNNFLSTRMEPDALKAYLSGVEAHAATISGQGGMGNGAKANGIGNATGQQGGNEPSLGTTTKPDGVYEMNGKHYRVKGGNVYAH